MTDDRKNKLRPPLRVVPTEEAERSMEAGKPHADAIGDFREWDGFRWNEDPSGYMIWARRVRKAIQDYMTGEEPMPDAYWFLRGFMSRWRRIHRGFVARFLERRAHYEAEVNGNTELSRQLMLYAKAVHIGRDLRPDGGFDDDLEDVVGLCPSCGRPVPSSGLRSFVAPEPAAYLQALHSTYQCEGCGWKGRAKSLIEPSKWSPPRE